MEFSFIRNQIRKYSTKSLLVNSINLLKQVESNPKQSYPIWEIFLLLKWTFIFSGDKHPTKEANQEIVQQLLSHIVQLQNQHELIKKKGSITDFLQVIAYQQSYLQFQIWKDSFARQKILYTILKSRYSIEDVFHKNTGITIEEFITLSFVLWTYTNPEVLNRNIKYDGFIWDDFIEVSNKLLDEKRTFKFLELLSLNVEKAKKVCVEDNRVKSEKLQPFEISIFTRYPIFNYNNKRILLHKNLLNYSLNFFVYDFMKQNDNENFTEEFGHRVEKYIELGLKEVNLPYKTESQLKKELVDKSKLVDFLVDDSILIESKAIELNPYPNVYPDKEVIYKWLKSSIVKAYSKQMITVANSLKNKKEKYGIIITYKETNFGNGVDAWNKFLKEPAESFAKDNGLELSILPAKNLFFIDLATWDRIILIIKKGQASLEEILKKAIENDSKEETKKFWFHMHLHDYDLGTFDLSYLNENFDIL